MRHHVFGYRLGRTKGARNALRRNLIKQFLTHERIQTTRAKAAAIRGEAERLITIARNSASGTDAQKLNSRRQVSARLGDDRMTKRLFEEIALVRDPLWWIYAVLKLGPRLGDSAEMVMLELVEE
jgi:large subunit ribosomal protein L17